jgi:hypothetical protein
MKNLRRIGGLLNIINPDIFTEIGQIFIYGGKFFDPTGRTAGFGSVVIVNDHARG